MHSRVLADCTLAILTRQQASNGAARVAHRDKRRVCHLFCKRYHMLRRLRIAGALVE
jgi:hypothetical protein